MTGHRGDTFRAVYTVRLSEHDFVLHAFQKKPKRGMATSDRYVDLIKRRLKLAIEISGARE
jgi:phage-related protein